MRKFITTLLFSFILFHGLAQTQKKVSLYLLGQYNKTLYDITKGNNISGFGTGCQLFFNVSPVFKPTIEVTGDAYLLNDKVYRKYLDGTPIPITNKAQHTRLTSAWLRNDHRAASLH